MSLITGVPFCVVTLNIFLLCVTET